MKKILVVFALAILVGCSGHKNPAGFAQPDEPAGKLVVTRQPVAGTCEQCPPGSYWSPYSTVAMIDFAVGRASFAYDNVEEYSGFLEGPEWLALEFHFKASAVGYYPSLFRLRYEATNREVVEFETAIFFFYNNLVFVRYNINYDGSEALHELLNIRSSTVPKGRIQVSYIGPKPGHYVPINWLEIPKPTGDSERRLVARWEAGNRNPGVVLNLSFFSDEPVSLGQMSVFRNGEHISSTTAIRENWNRLVYDGGEMINIPAWSKADIDLIVELQEDQVKEGDIYEVSVFTSGLSDDVLVSIGNTSGQPCP